MVGARGTQGRAPAPGAFESHRCAYDAMTADCKMCFGRTVKHAEGNSGVPRRRLRNNSISACFGVTFHSSCCDASNA